MDNIRQRDLDALKQLCADTIWPEGEAEPIFPARVDGHIAVQIWQKWCQLSGEVRLKRFENKLENFIREEGRRSMQ